MHNNDKKKLTKIVVKREREVAYHSPDHILPWGTRRDNSRNRLFNQKLYQLYSKPGYMLKVLDLGCSGGGFVKDCIDDGCLAIGLEGSDFSKKCHRAEWATIPEYLFTCDITGEFEVLHVTDGSEERIRFDVITSWEVIEHISEQDLPGLVANIKKHLLPDGLWLMSVSPNEEVINGIRLHQTVQAKPWWIAKFEQLGLEHREEYIQYFNTQFVRGPKYGAPGSFHLALCFDKSKAPHVPKQKFSSRLYDLWFGSSLQRKVRYILLGID